MTYTECSDKYNGQWIDYDGQYGCQCWDLAQRYFTECLGVPEWVLSGCGLVCNMLWQPKRSDLDAYFDEVSVYEMAQGDVCIWEEGHIAILDNWDGNNLWFFSQNPNPCQVMQCNLGSTMHAFRLRKEQPAPPKEVTPNVERDEYSNQIEVKEEVTELRVRSTPNLDGEIIGKANTGFYNYYEIVEADDYNWYKIADNQWIAYSDEWENVYPAKPKEEFVQLKVLDKKDGYVLVDLGKVWIKEN